MGYGEDQREVFVLSSLENLLHKGYYIHHFL
jgi:hypothetical protein